MGVVCPARLTRVGALSDDPEPARLSSPAADQRLPRRPAVLPLLRAGDRHRRAVRLLAGAQALAGPGTRPRPDRDRRDLGGGRRILTGNYVNQELFGTPTKLPWALEVEQAHRPARYQGFATFHPTFLYESLWDLVIVGVLLWLSARRRLRTGSIVLCYLGMYAFGRFLLELIRTDTTFRLLGLSRNAWVA